MLPTLTIARNTFVESLRQPVFFLIVVLSGVLQLLNTAATGFSMGFRNVPGEVTGDDRLLFDVGLATVFVCGILLAAFIATAAVSREIENKTVLTVVSKPIGRPSVIIGKFFGVAGAMAIATAIMVIFLLLALRHGVLSTAGDRIDGPVLVFGIGAVLLAFVIAAATNYLYGWPFGQTTITVMLPALVVGYFLVLLLSDRWAFQPITADLKPQILIACVSLSIALLVITAVAVAASTRLGQVMTIVICAGVFVLGLLSNHLLGRHAFQNEPVGEVVRTQNEAEVSLFELVRPELRELAARRLGIEVEDLDRLNVIIQDIVTPADAIRLVDRTTRVGREVLFIQPGVTYTVELSGPPDPPIRRGDPFFYGRSPNGVGLAVPAFRPAADEIDIDRTLQPRGTPSGVYVVGVDDLSVTVRNVGPEAHPVARPPLPGDYVFTRPTRINWPATVAWSVIPNMHFFWLVDAISQAQPVPPGHVILIILYGAMQVVAFLALAVVLFQGRDVG